MGVEMNSFHLEETREAMTESRGYDPVKAPFALLFEYLAEVRVRSKQARIINFVLESLMSSQSIDSEDKEELEGKVFQLIMAGGKTSVIISMLVELSSEAGLLACVLSHHSQMTSVTGTLSDFQSKRFHKDIYVIDYGIQDLSKQKVLDLIVKRLNEADRKHCAIVMKTTFPQILELKFIIEVMRLKEMTTFTERQRQIQKISSLQKINHIFQGNGAGFYDESDINLSMLLDVIIPLGAQKNVKAERAALVKSIFDCIVEDDAILNLTGLIQNSQAELSTADFDNKLLPFIAQKMYDYPPLKLSSDFALGESKLSKGEIKDTFTRYVCNQISVEEQHLADNLEQNLDYLDKEMRENVLFLRYLAKSLLRRTAISKRLLI